MAGISRKKTAGHVSPRLFAAQSAREKRSLEGSPKSHGRPRPRSEERQVFLTHHGNSARLADGADLGRLRFYCALRDPPYRHPPCHVLYAVDWIRTPDNFSSVARRMGATCGWIGMAAVGLGNFGRLHQCVFHTGAVPIV